MDSGPCEAQSLQNVLERLGVALVHGELHELHSMADRAWRQVGQVRYRDARAALDLIKHEEQRALPIHRNTAGGAGAESVVEDLKRQEAIETRGLQSFHEIVDGEVALPREASVMAAPRQVI